MQNPEKLSDKELYEKCCFCGAQARNWSKKFAALLPEVEKRALYKKHGFYSIFEFAAKLAGMSRETVVEILRVARKLEDMPLLKEQMETQGWSKLRIVASIATKENEKMLAQHVCHMSKPALEAFANEIKKQEAASVQILPGEGGPPQSQSALIEPTQDSLDSSTAQQATNAAAQSSPIASPTPPRVFVRLLLKPKTELRLKELQKKLSKKISAPVDLNEVMETLLDAYDSAATTASAAAKIQAQKSYLGSINHKIFSLAAQIKRKIFRAIQNAEEAPAGDIIQQKKPVSRYIPVQIKKTLYAKYGGRCAFPGCTKLPEIYHHTRRFSLNSNHDPDFLMPLCKGHEQLAHHGLIENEEKQPVEWRLRFAPNKSEAKYWVDRKVNAFRRTTTNNPTRSFRTPRG